MEKKLRRQEIQKRYRIKNKDKIKEYNIKIKARRQASTLKRKLEIKLKVFEHYAANAAKCNICGIKNIRCLTIDHIDGGGKKHRGKVGDIYRYLFRNKFPLGFQVLCMNCNWLKSNSTHKCHHPRQIIRKKVLCFYSGGELKCKDCGISDIRVLCLDHINGDGYIHRKIVGGSVNVYVDLIARNFPEGFQVLCQNCNLIKKAENNENRWNRKTPTLEYQKRNISRNNNSGQKYISESISGNVHYWLVRMQNSKYSIRKYFPFKNDGMALAIAYRDKIIKGV